MKLMNQKEQRTANKVLPTNIFIKLTLIFVLGYGLIGLLSWFN